MITKKDFAAADWSPLRDTQYLVGLATLSAGSSGLGTIKESLAIAQGIAESQASSFPFVRDLTSGAEMEAAQSSLRELLGGPQGMASSDNLQRIALEKVRTSLSLLIGRATVEEIDDYRRLLYGLAEKVANAAKEGGILGFGGTQVSTGEQTFLDDLRDTLQLERAKRA